MARKQKVKLKLETKHVVIAVVAIAAAFSAGFLFIFYGPGAGQDELEGVYFIDYGGVALPFRADPVRADRVEVLPSEAEVQQQILKPPSVRVDGQIIFRQPLKNVTIVFNPEGVAQERMGYYTVQVTEIIKKLQFFYQGQFGIELNFAISEVDSYDGLRGTNTAPVVALVHPDIADGTFVSGDSKNNVITISGGDSLEDFDLASVKFMMIALGIDVDQNTA